MLPELTLLLIGDINSIAIRPENILLDHEEKTKEGQFSSRLYDMCGRHISVINLLGLQNIDKIPLNEAIHAFLLLLPYGMHNSHYSSTVQELEKKFGKEFLLSVMTVVTHEPAEKCENALADLKANSSFDEKRYHTCSRNMTDEKEIIALLEKIDAMVSENHPHGRLMRNECKEEREEPSNNDEEAKTDYSIYQQNKRGEWIKTNDRT